MKKDAESSAVHCSHSVVPPSASGVSSTEYSSTRWRKSNTYTSRSCTRSASESRRSGDLNLVHRPCSWACVSSASNRASSTLSPMSVSSCRPRAGYVMSARVANWQQAMLRDESAHTQRRLLMSAIT